MGKEQINNGPAKSADLVEIDRLIGYYRSIVPIISSTECPSLKRLADSWEAVLPQFSQRLTSSSKHELRLAKKGLRQGLKEVPEIIESIKGLDHSKLISSIEEKLNIKFAEL